MPKHVVAEVAEIPAGGRKAVLVKGRPIVIFNLGGEFFGLLDRCPHQSAELSRGMVSTGIATLGRAGSRDMQPAGRVHPLPVAWLGVRHPHRPVLDRSLAHQGAADQRSTSRPAARWCRDRSRPRRSSVQVDGAYVVVDV
jgi:hypothetical protein